MERLGCEIQVEILTEEVKSLVQDESECETGKILETNFFGVSRSIKSQRSAIKQDETEVGNLRMQLSWILKIKRNAWGVKFRLRSWRRNSSH